MKTIKIKVPQPVREKEIEVSLPYYSKSFAYNFKVVSETKCISVCLGVYPGIEVLDAYFGLKSDNERSNEAEFNAAYDTARKIIVAAIEDELEQSNKH